MALSSRAYSNSKDLTRLRKETLISPEELHAQRETRQDLRVVDATWGLDTTHDYHSDFLQSRIQGSVYFNIDKIADTSSNLPHMLPSSQKFAEAMDSLGISNSDEIIVYDRSGVFVASARCWWTFKVFGHQRVRVLEGGLGRWTAKGYPIETGPSSPPSPKSGYKPEFHPELVQSFDQMIDNMKSKKQMADARPPGRFKGVEPEPRPGLRSGHIPGSVSIPHLQLLADSVNGGSSFLPSEQLQQLFKEKGLDLNSFIATSCGSGVTASVVALGIHLAGGQNYSVYDGSFAEWGQPALEDKAPVAVDQK